MEVQAQEFFPSTSEESSLFSEAEFPQDFQHPTNQSPPSPSQTPLPKVAAAPSPSEHPSINPLTICKAKCAEECMIQGVPRLNFTDPCLGPCARSCMSQFQLVFSNCFSNCTAQSIPIDVSSGSCNGLVCIAPDEDTLFLFNPSTRESKRIPDPPSGLARDGLSVYGFGFDFGNDDYKVVKLGCGTVCVYSLRTDSWGKVGNFPFDDNVYESGVLLNENIHWMASRGEGANYECVVAAFSLEKEVFWDMRAPDTVDASVEFVVGVLNGCLCVLHSRNQMHNDFWVMTKYGVAESWTKLTLSISYICMKPLCLAQNGEVLLEVDGKLLLYNLEDDSYRYLVIHGIPAENGFEADTYLESLVSPNSYYRSHIAMP
ncbi:hypothetical protein CCACVL1_28330 [Corchorus capsularis]|uniref:F-box associated beta-propeller type 1 domain-containing protein n=1 Tax=Corchorus capsularis TaxID=210143 RepID=A0A1R3G6T7_COCAP|nr:hypothetical protein CCACVL1_28330 [Corchorus capsularis]